MSHPTIDANSSLCLRPDRQVVLDCVYLTQLATACESGHKSGWAWIKCSGASDMSKSRDTFSRATRMRLTLAFLAATAPDSSPEDLVPFVQGCQQMELSPAGYKGKRNAQKAAMGRGETIIEAQVPDRRQVGESFFFLKSQVEQYLRDAITHCEQQAISKGPDAATFWKEG